MNKKTIKNLAKLSYTKENLDEQKAQRVVKYFKRNEIKAYIRYLRLIEKSKTLKVYLSNIGETKILNLNLKKFFPNKKIVIMEDKSLIAGLRIVNGDDVYENNLKNTLNNISTYINE